MAGLLRHPAHRSLWAPEPVALSNAAFVSMYSAPHPTPKPHPSPTPTPQPPPADMFKGPMGAPPKPHPTPNPHPAPATWERTRRFVLVEPLSTGPASDTAHSEEALTHPEPNALP